MTATTLPPMTELLQPLGRRLTPDFARKIIGLRAPAAVQRKVARLAAKANEGQLTPEERDEYRSYVLAGNMVAYLQAQARLLLARTDA